MADERGAKDRATIATKLGWKDSNLRYAVPKTAALPLGYTPKNPRKY